MLLGVRGSLYCLRQRSVQRPQLVFGVPAEPEQYHSSWNHIWEARVAPRQKTGDSLCPFNRNNERPGEKCDNAKEKKTDAEVRRQALFNVSGAG